ncbi:ABC transporter substrate-binding protein [Curvibacter sp. HBC61]|uniref:ABC transporter substrate-binding protein n=1 Tax=Curvibacter cyanobacteriorum TaxID=3026422 RepID=A0ABT5MVA3_9BURK|nr:ABC transporter substrate-binding protein [Curvibacter sp. HBC61]MDD0837830.1 ABC transporter substrate-binding protein [Curvibacter sp. HBC61]
MTPFVLNRRACLGAGLAAVVAAPALRAQPKLEQSSVSIAVGGKGTFYYLPLTVAEALGYFKAEGLDVDIRDFVGGARALQAVLSGPCDVCAGAFEHTITWQVRQQALKAFVLMGRAPQVVVGVSQKTLPHYRGLGDLRGRKVGVSSPGSSTNTVVNLLLARAGLKPSEVSFQGVGVQAGALAALRSGSIDVISNVDPVVTQLEQKGEIRVIADTRTLKGADDVFGGLMPAGSLYAPSDYVKRHPRTVQALTNAIVHALKWLQTAGPSDLLQTVPESYLLGDRALYLAAFGKVREALSLDGLVPEEGPRTALRALATFDPALKAERVDLSKVYTNEFARRAKDRFKA